MVFLAASKGMHLTGCARNFKRCVGFVRWQRRNISSLLEPNKRTTTSSLFMPSRDFPELKMATNLSHKLMVRGGLISQSCSGVYHFLPMGLRAMNKLSQLVHSAMDHVGALQMAMPVLTPATLWRKSGRWDSVGSELFRLKDWRGTDYCLGPTHEEAVTDLVKQELSSYRQLPLRMYQLDRKFRDEARPRYGLLRCREFWMKDLYTFDRTQEEALQTYHDVCTAYEHLLLKQLNLPAIKVQADTGDIGGSLSHEYHLPAAIGMDTLLTCDRCGVGASAELLGDTGEVTQLPNCPRKQDHTPCKLSMCKGIEIGHSFLLGTKYSSVFDLTYTDKDGRSKLVEMGCYGIGVSRLLAAALEVGCNHSNDRLMWPRLIAPYHVCILPMIHDLSDPIMAVGQELYDSLQEVCPGDVVLEDRVHLTLGARRRDMEVLGYPITVIVGKKTPQDHYEVSIQEQDGTCDSQTVELDTLINMVRTSYDHQL